MVRASLPLFRLTKKVPTFPVTVALARMQVQLSSRVCDLSTVSTGRPKDCTVPRQFQEKK